MTIKQKLNLAKPNQRSIINSITFLLFFFMLLSEKGWAQTLGINTTGALPDSSAMLDIISPTKGLLIPRVSLASTADTTTITNPAISLLVYNTNVSMTGGSGLGYYYYNGSMWMNFLSGTGNSLTTPLIIGGSGTTSSLTFKPTIGVGTTGADHVFAVGNNGATEAMRILNNGKVGIGTSSPATELDVDGSINSVTGFRIANAATSGYYLRGNGTDFVSSAIQPGDFPSGSGNYVQNQVASDQAAGLRITGNGLFNGGQITIGTATPSSGYLLTLNTSSGISKGLDIAMSGGTGTGVNVTSSSSSHNGILVSNSSTSVSASFNGIGSVLSSTNIVSGYAGFRNSSGLSYGIYGVNGTNATYAANASTWAAFLRGRTVISSETSPSSGLGTDLEIRNTTTGAGNPATVSMRQGTSNTTNATVLANLNFGDNHQTGPQAQIQIARGAAGGASDLPTDMVFSTTPDASVTLTERMRILSNGNVGIGTVAPSSKVEINDVDKTVLDLYRYNNLAINTTDAFAINKGGAISFGGTYYTGSPTLYGFGAIKGAKEDATSGLINGYLAFITTAAGIGSREWMRINSTGNVGIGTTVPSTKLHISATTEQLRLGYDASNYSSTTVDNSGNVTHDAVGSTSKFVFNDMLSMAANKPISLPNFTQLDFKNTSGTLGYGQIFVDNATGTYAGPNGMAFFLNSAVRISILSGGNVGIGTTSPSAKLHTLSTTEQLRIGYDASNYYSTTVASTGGVTFDAIGAGSAFTFSDAVNLPSASAGVTQALNDSTTKLATTAFVDRALSGVSGGSGWGLTGTSGTVDGTNFIGTTDNIPFTVKVNNQKAGRIDNYYENAFWGYQAGNANTTGAYNTVNGHQALYTNTTGSDNTAIGHKALYSNTTGTLNNAIGDVTLQQNTTGSYNTATGAQALNYNTTGSFNTATGMQTLTVNTTGDQNTATGYNALNSNSTGYQNTGHGFYAGNTNTTGYNNSFFGYNANPSTAALNNSAAIGANTSVNASNKIRIGDANVTVIEGQVAFTSVSDGRFKKNISESDVKGLAFIMRLRPVVYNLDTRQFEEFQTKNLPESVRIKHFKNRDFTASTAIRHSGFVAQEVELAAKETNYDFDGIHKPEGPDDNYGIAYSEFVVPLVKAMQEQQQQLIAKDAILISLQNQIDQLTILIQQSKNPK